MNVRGLDWVVMATPDIDEQAATLSELLGVSFGETNDVRLENPRGSQHVQTRLSPAGIDLLQPMDDDNEIATFLDQNGPDWYAVGMQVSDLDEADAHLDSRGVESVSTYESGTFREKYYHPRKLGGLLALAEHPHPVESAMRQE